MPDHLWTVEPIRNASSGANEGEKKKKPEILKAESTVKREEKEKGTEKASNQRDWLSPRTPLDPYSSYPIHTPLATNKPDPETFPK